MRALRPALLGVLLLASPAAGAASLTVHYVSSWAGLPAGEIDLQVDDEPAGYRSRIEIRTAGAPRWFTRFRARATSEGGLSLLGLAAPERYDAVYDLRSRKDKRISLRFPRWGTGTVAERGAEDGSDSPPIDARERINAIDPLAALVRMRQAIRDGLLPRGPLSIPVYDGKRRFDIETRGYTHETREAAGKTWPLLHLDLTLRPIAGFSGNDSEGNPDATPRQLDVLLSDDAALVPLRFEVTVAWLGAIVQCVDPKPLCAAVE